LKPAINDSGLVSKLLNAATGSDSAEKESGPENSVQDDFAAEFPEFSDAEHEFSELTAPLFDSSVSTASNSGQRTMPGASLNADSKPFGSAGTTGDLASLTEQLERLGATRTIWFSPGSEQTIGFVAFFASDGMVTYRFEAIAESRSAAVQDVLRQVQEWKTATR
ncbi:MAG: hypothetical protein KDA89_01000, partial [Planctomycetaceae bacterium]|nr:hypothetical protein [Planctomycetaceae bacterium]